VASSKQRSSDRGRLSRSAEFERVYRQGRSTANRHLVLYAFPNATSQRPRLGLSVSRKVGGAVERNRVKRMLRESFARVEPTLREGHDVVVVARPSAAELVEREGIEGVETALAELIAKGGLRSAVSEPQAQSDREASDGATAPETDSEAEADSRAADRSGDRGER
jgi:ribonuclease P protein component